MARELIDTSKEDYTSYLEKEPTGTAKGLHAFLEESLGTDLDLQTVYLVNVLGQKFQASKWWNTHRTEYVQTAASNGAAKPAKAKATAKRGPKPAAKPARPAAKSGPKAGSARTAKPAGRRGAAAKPASGRRGKVAPY